MATRKLLLIDDEEMVRNSVGRILRMHGYEALLARDGVEGLRLLALHREEIGLVVLDWILPRMSGEEVLAEIRRLDPELAVVVFSGHQDSMRCTEADAVLRKPIDPKVFIYQLERYMHRRAVPGVCVEK